MQNAVQDLKSYTGGSVSAEEYAIALGISDRMLPFFNALVGNANGSTAENIGALGMGIAEQAWSAGYDQYVLKSISLTEVIANKFSSILPLIEYNRPITNVDTSNSKVILTDQNGNTIECDKVVVTVPFFQMQHNDFTFTPPLPSIYRQAINAAGYDKAGIKIVLKFDSSFWPDNMGSLYTSGHVPEYYPTSFGANSSSYHLLTATVMGSKAQDLSNLGDLMISTILSELDQVFGGTLATDHFIEHLLQDWGTVPYINGAMSYPKIGTLDTRQVFNEPVSKKIYFAGEATNATGHFGTVHGALETGLRAANLILTGA
jgi:monoamine oxidase